MGLFSSLRKSVVSAVFPVLVLCSASSQATTVQFQTSLGNIDVVLFDKTTPKTVENFFYYLNAGAYTNGVIHRSAKILDSNNVERKFVIQGGSYTFSGAMPLSAVKIKDSVVNEPLYSNVRGTIAMAKLANSADSATSGWFFNLEDNSSILDRDNGGYTVFGQITPASLAVLDEIAAVNTFFATSSSPEFPLRNYTVDDYRNNAPVDENNLVLITSVVVLDPSPNTQDAITPVANPYYEPPAEDLDDDSGGGSLGWYWLILCSLLALGFRHKTA